MTWLSLILGIAIMSLGADWVVGGTSRLARHLHMSAFAVSALFLGFSNNIPELMVTFFSAGESLEPMIVPMLVSSNIVNILGIVGIGAALSPIYIKGRTRREVTVLLASSALFAVMLYDGKIDIAEGIGLLAIFAWYISGTKMRASHYNKAAGHDWLKTTVLLLFGAIALYAGGYMFMDGVIGAVKLFHLNGSAAGAIIAAPATSGPEIIVTIMAIIRKRPEILIGNMVGSCIAHIILVAGIAGILTEPVSAPTFDILFMLAVTVIFAIDIGWRKKIDCVNGLIYVTLLCLYFAAVIV